MKGRPSLPPGEARTMMLKTFVKPAAGEKFKALAKARGLTVAAAHREALMDWLTKHQETK